MLCPSSEYWTIIGTRYLRCYQVLIDGRRFRSFVRGRYSVSVYLWLCSMFDYGNDEWWIICSSIMSEVEMHQSQGKYPGSTNYIKMFSTAKSDWKLYWITTCHDETFFSSLLYVLCQCIIFGMDVEHVHCISSEMCFCYRTTAQGWVLKLSLVFDAYIGLFFFCFWLHMHAQFVCFSPFCLLTWFLNGWTDSKLWRDFRKNAKKGFGFE